MDKALHTIITYCVSVIKFELSNLSFDFLICLEGEVPPPLIFFTIGTVSFQCVGQ